MVIREARPSDAAAMARLAGQLGYPATPSEFERRMAARSGSARAVYVAQGENDALIGWTEVAGIEMLIAEPYADLAALIVDEPRRGEGIGRRLVERALAWAHANGYAVLRVRSNVIRERAHRFYEDLGFERVKTQAVFARATAPEMPGWPARA